MEAFTRTFNKTFRTTTTTKTSTRCPAIVCDLKFFDLKLIFQYFPLQLNDKLGTAISCAQATELRVGHQLPLDSGMSNIYIVHIYVRRLLTRLSLFVQDEGDNKVLKLRFDVSQYAPEEIVVKTVDQKLLVS